jgi:hypothetical protein
MGITLGTEVNADRAHEWTWHVGRLLPQTEDLTALVAGEGTMKRIVYAVTTDRVLTLQTHDACLVTETFDLVGVRNVYTSEDQVGKAVHVPMLDGGHWLLRPAQADVDLLGRAISEAVAAKNKGASRESVRPFDAGTGQPTMLEAAGLDYLMLVIPHREVEAGDVGPTLSVLTELVRSRRTARAFMERVALAFDGYNDTTQELFEIPQVREFVQSLDGRFPYWLYFLDKTTSSFDALWRCYMPPFLSPEAQKRELPARIGPMLENWWIPAMDTVCEFVEMTEPEYVALSERFALYLQGHRGFKSQT